MKIGIVTYHRSYNFGAVLQAYALKTYISSLGNYEVSFINYWPMYHREMYKLFNVSLFKKLSIIGKLKYLISCILRYYRKKKKQNNFSNFISKYIYPLSDYKSEFYDLVIYGSDQIWRFQDHPSYRGYNLVYYGDETIKGKRKIAYSASMGVINDSVELRNILRKCVNNFNAISVRENDLYNYIRPYNVDTRLTVDPVFLLNRSYWLDFVNSVPIRYTPYVLVYNLQRNDAVEAIASRISQKFNIPIIHVTGDVVDLFPVKNVEDTLGPLEFVSLIRDASYVITSSFHGFAFSLLLNKEFYVSMNNNSERVYTMLSTLGLTDRMVDSYANFDIQDDINWEIVNVKLHSVVVESEKYLINNIN